VVTVVMTRRISFMRSSLALWASSIRLCVSDTSPDTLCQHNTGRGADGQGHSRGTATAAGPLHDCSTLNSL
jgi:hypothetical protein